MTRLCKALAVLVLVAGAMCTAQGATIKLATLAPDGTVWHRALQEMGAEWQRATSNGVQLRIYPGGVAGDDPDMVRKMRIGQLQAALLTVAGLASIDGEINVFTIPLFFDSYEEHAYVLDKLRPYFAQRFEQRGYVLLGWAHGGWVHLFSKQPVRTVEDLRSIKLFSWAGDDTFIQVWKSNGFHPVALASTDILTGLQTGMIDAIPTTPLAALTLQWYKQTPYMTELGVAPLVGALVMTKTAWDRIPEAQRPALRSAALAAEAKMSHEIPRLDDEAVQQMKERGLTVVGLDGDPAAGGWRKLADTFAERMRKSMVPEEVFAQALRYRDEYRAAHSGAKP